VLNQEEWEWRGEIKNTSTGEVRYFRDFRVLCELLPVLLTEPRNELVEQQGVSEPFYLYQERTMNTTAQTLEASVHATNRAFEAAFARGDAAAVAAVYTTTGQAFPPNWPTVVERKRLQSFWQRVMDVGFKNITLETIELQSCGDFAYEIGEATLYAEGWELMVIAKFIVIWQQEEGRWKWHRQIWNSNPPA
jgi:ketosteroid isomerase-like protein